MFESKWIREKARESGLIERERKIDPVIMFWTLAIVMAHNYIELSRS